jgi:membrane-associated phospholipid phosphatase
MPSLHVGWAVLIAIGMYRAFPGNRLVMLFAAVHPVVQWSSTVFTGNHYILDGVEGLVVATLGLAIATFMQRRGYAFLREKLGIEHEPAVPRPAQKGSAP